MYRVFGLRLGPNFGVWPAADKNLYLWLTVEKILALADFTKKYLRSYGCAATNFTAAVNFAHQKNWNIYHCSIAMVVVPLKYKIVKIKLSVLIKNISALLSTQYFVCS